MVRKRKKTKNLIKIVDERYSLSRKRGGGIIRFEAWEDNDGVVVKYNIAYINHLIYQEDNGRVLGFDNAHDGHHMHKMGTVSPVEDFENYENIVERFEIELSKLIK